MKKKVISILVGAAMATSLLAGCGSSSTATTTSETADASSAVSAESEAAEADSEEEAVVEEVEEAATSEVVAEEEVEETVGGMDATGKTIAFVVRSAGNPYIQKEESGFQEAVEACGGTVIISEPEAATADAQISLIQALISQNVDAIAVGANDANALSASLQQAQDAGIKVLCIDADVNPEDRATFVNQTSNMDVGQALVDAVYDLTGGEGEFAILSATSQSTNQNAWIDAMQSIMDSDEKYANLVLDEIAYGDDEPQKSTDQTQALITKYPDLKVICSPTTVGIAAAAKVLQDQESSIKLTGLGLPSEMAEYIGDDDEHSCPYMFLWNPIELGQLGGYTAVALVTGQITGEVGDTFEAEGLENSPFTLTELEGGGGSEVILGQPFRFDPSNIDEWKDIY